VLENPPKRRRVVLIPGSLDGIRSTAPMMPRPSISPHACLVHQ